MAFCSPSLLIICSAGSRCERNESRTDAVRGYRIGRADLPVHALHGDPVNVMCGPADGLEQRTADEFERAWDESDDITDDDCSVEFEQGEET